jgi:hypothetical protein
MLVRMRVGRHLDRHIGLMAPFDGCRCPSGRPRTDAEQSGRPRPDAEQSGFVNVVALIGMNVGVDDLDVLRPAARSHPHE